MSNQKKKNRIREHKDQSVSTVTHRPKLTKFKVYVKILILGNPISLYKRTCIYAKKKPTKPNNPTLMGVFAIGRGRCKLFTHLSICTWPIFSVFHGIFCLRYLVIKPSTDK